MKDLKQQDKMVWVLAPQQKQVKVLLPLALFLVLAIVVLTRTTTPNTGPTKEPTSLPNMAEASVQGVSPDLGYMPDAGDFVGVQDISGEKIDALVKLVELPPNNNEAIRGQTESGDPTVDFFKAALNNDVPKMRALAESWSDIEKERVKVALLLQAQEQGPDDIQWVQAAHNALLNGLEDSSAAGQLLKNWEASLKSLSESSNNMPAEANEAAPSEVTVPEANTAPELVPQGEVAPPEPPKGETDLAERLQKAQPLTPVDTGESGYLLMPATPEDIVRGMRNLLGAFSKTPLETKCMYVLETYRHGSLLFLTMGTSKEIVTPHMNGEPATWFPDNNAVLPNGVWAPAGTSWTGDSPQGQWDTVLVIWKGNPPFNPGEAVCGSNVLANFAQQFKK